MSHPTRRGFLTFVGAGAAAAAGAATLGAATASAAPAAAGVTTGDTDAPGADGATGSLVAYVHDASTGEIAVMVDGHETVVTDHALVARLTRSARA